TGSDATGACGDTSVTYSIPGHSSRKSSAPAWLDVRLAMPLARTLAPIRFAIDGRPSVGSILTRTRRPSTVMCRVFTLNRSDVVACATPSTEIHSQSTRPLDHSPGDVRLATGRSASPSTLTLGLASFVPLWAGRVSPQ